MKTFKNFIGCSLIIGIGFAMAFHAQAQSMTSSGESQGSVTGAKALFASPEGTSFVAEKKTSSSGGKPTAKKPEAEKYMGIAYWIELLTPDGKRMLTSKQKTFRSGDRIKLNVETNQDGFLYIVSIGSTGSSRLLFPYSGEKNNFVFRRKVYSVPQNTYMKFDNNPGEETLLVLLSPRLITELETQSPTIDPVQTRRYEQYASRGSKDILIEEADTRSAKDLVLEGDTTATYRNASAVADVVVAPMPSSMPSLENHSDVICLYIKLKHY